MSAKKALFVGINKFAKYPQFTLNGCVNDARDMAATYRQKFGFKAAEITVLTDAAATKKAIMAELAAMVKAAKAGKLDQLVFAMSSHGTQIADTSGDEPDGQDEAFVPHDIAEKNGNWDPAHVICDDELHDLFVQLPDAVLLEVYLDTCHSGSGLRGAEFGPHAPRARFVMPPSRAFGSPQPRMRGFSLDRQAVGGANHVLWAACKANQTSADAFFSGRYNGAFTYHYLQAVKAASAKATRQQLVTAARKAMAGQFVQTPQLECNASNRKAAVVY